MSTRAALPDSPGAIAAPPRRVAALWTRLAAGAAVLAVVLALAARIVDWPRTLDAVARASTGWVVAAVAANAMIVLLWGGYWQRLTPGAEHVPYRRMLGIVAITSSVMNTVPFGAGHATGAVLLARRGRMTAHGALNVVILDQLGEGVAKTTIYLLVALLAPLPVWMHAGVLLAAGGAAGLLLVLLVMAHRYAEHPDQPIEHTATVAGRAREHVRRWARGLETLRSWRRSGAALVWVLGMKCAEIAGILCVQRAFDVRIAAGGTLLVMAALVLGTMIPVSPGNIGTYEGSVFLAYRYAGLSAETALALALVQHLCFMVSSIGIGYIVLSRGMLRRVSSAARPS